MNKVFISNSGKAFDSETYFVLAIIRCKEKQIDFHGTIKTCKNNEDIKKQIFFILRKMYEEKGLSVEKIIIIDYKKSKQKVIFF